MEGFPAEYQGFFRVLAIVGISVGGLISLLNWWTVIKSRRSERRISPIPVLGFLPLGLGLFYFPESRSFSWMCFIADYFVVHLAVEFVKMVAESIKKDS